MAAGKLDGVPTPPPPLRIIRLFGWALIPDPSWKPYLSYLVHIIWEERLLNSVAEPIT